MRYTFERYLPDYDLWVADSITHVSEDAASRWYIAVLRRGKVRIRKFRGP